MAFQEVSSYPISLKTPCKTSLTASGGIRKALISLIFAGFKSPTADLAASTSGYTPLSSSSTCCLLTYIIY